MMGGVRQHVTALIGQAPVSQRNPRLLLAESQLRGSAHEDCGVSCGRRKKREKPLVRLIKHSSRETEWSYNVHAYVRSYFFMHWMLILWIRLKHLDFISSGSG